MRIAAVWLYLGRFGGEKIGATAEQGVPREKNRRVCEAKFLTRQARHASQLSTCGSEEVVYSAVITEIKLLPQPEVPPIQ
jgi:hypothetical protein